VKKQEKPELLKIMGGRKRIVDYWPLEKCIHSLPKKNKLTCFAFLTKGPIKELL
jgi:hypothetical protein